MLASFLIVPTAGWSAHRQEQSVYDRAPELKDLLRNILLVT